RLRHVRRGGTRASVLGCGSPLSLSHRPVQIAFAIRSGSCDGGRESGRRLPHSKGFATSGAGERAPAFWSATALCRFRIGRCKSSSRSKAVLVPVDKKATEDCSTPKA